MIYSKESFKEVVEKVKGISVETKKAFIEDMIDRMRENINRLESIDVDDSEDFVDEITECHNIDYLFEDLLDEGDDFYGE